jgi:hypothetical protein
MYQIGTLGTALRPSEDKIFKIGVGPSMSQSVLFFVRTTGVMEYYSPTAQTLNKVDFYLSLDQCSWLRAA